MQRFFCWKMLLSARVIDYHKPSGGLPGAVWVGRSGHPVGNESQAARYAAESPASDESVAHPHLVCADPDSNGSTIGTSRADHQDGSSLSPAKQKVAAMHSRQSS